MDTKMKETIIDPLNGEAMVMVPDTQHDEIAPFVARMKDCPRTGLHVTDLRRTPTLAADFLLSPFLPNI